MKNLHHILSTSIATLLGLVLTSTPASAQTGVFSNSGALGTTDQTANVGLSSLKTYVEAIDLGDAGNTTVNGVVFTGSGILGNPSGTGWAITGTPSRNAGGGTLIAGSLGSLMNNFIYGGNPEVLTLTGLTVG